jgi:hypothetical protein
MAVRTKAKYDPISAEDKRQEDEKRRLQLNKEYRVHQLRELGMFGELGDGTADPESQMTCKWWPGTGQARQRRIPRAR